MAHVSQIHYLTSNLRRLHLCHVIAHSLQLHSSTEHVKLVQARNITVEGLLRARFKTLVHQRIIDTGGTFACHSLQDGVVCPL